jgi:acetylornithine deacetylase/succinyl-diaminopimelate desuccinylase-like protein
MVNCRIVPGETPEQTRETLVKVVADPQILVKVDRLDTQSAPSPLSREVTGAIEKLAAKFWPGAPMLPIMSAGATDGRFLRNAGIPTYGHSGLAGDMFDNRSHGQDERVAVKSFFDGLEYQYQLVKLLAGGK